MANDYCTALEIKDILPDVEWSGAYDAILTSLITRASRAIDGHLKRAPGLFYSDTDLTFYFDGSGESQLWIGELAAAPTSVAVAEDGNLSTYTAWSSTDYILWPYNAPSLGIPYQRLDIDLLYGAETHWYAYPKNVKIVGKFGFSTTVPDEIKQATIIQTMRWFKRGQQAFQDTGAVLELGQLRYLQKLDPDVLLLLEEPRFQRVTI